MKLRVGKCLELGPARCHGGDRKTWRSIYLAGWHNPRSITWLWSLIWNWWPHWTWRLLSVWRRNGSGQVRVRVPFVGHLDLHWQTPMWRQPEPEPLRAPDAMIVCARCGEDVAIVLPSDPRDVYFKALRQFGRPVCPACLRAASEVSQ